MRGASIMRTMSALLCALTCQTVSMDLDKIKAECEDECCNPPGSSAKATSSAIFGAVNTAIPEATTEHSEIQRFHILANENSKSGEAATEHSESPVADKKNETTILEAATKHSMIRRLLTLANENPKSGKAATELSERPKKLGKGTNFHAREKSPVPNSESSVTDDDYDSWLQSHGYST